MSENYFNIEVNNCNIRGIIHRPKKFDYIILYCYGFIGDRVDCHRLAVEAGRYFSKNNIAFVRFDCRGSGASDGDSIEFGYYDLLEDIKAVLEFFKKIYLNKKFILIGISEGAISASYITQICLEKKPSLILWSPIYRKSNNTKNHKENSSLEKSLLTSENAHLSSHAVSSFGLWINYRYFIERNKISDSINLLTLNNILCIYGTNDKKVVSTIDELTKMKNVDIYKITGADHLFSSTRNKNMVFKETVNWINNL